MPTTIYERTSKRRVAWLCSSEWRLREQVDSLIEWIRSDGSMLQSGDYVADIGFCWRRSASGGGAVVSSEISRSLADKGITLLLSEYPGFDDEDREAEQGAAANP